jgi:hypothetical protein
MSALATVPPAPSTLCNAWIPPRFTLLYYSDTFRKVSLRNTLSQAGFRVLAVRTGPFQGSVVLSFRRAEG